MHFWVFLVVLSLLVVSWMIVRYYSEPKSAHPLSTFVTVLALLCSMLCIFLIPLDVLSVTSHSVDVVVVETAFHALFGVVALLAFVLIPFTYFFVEDEEGDDDLLGGYSRAGCFDRAVGALRNTAFFVIAIVILVLVALFFKPMSETTKESSDVHVWVKTLLSEWQGGAIERGLLLTVGCMAVLGLLNLVLYTAYGLAALPVYMMRSTQALEDEQIKEDMNEVERQQKRTVIQSKLQDPTTSGKLRDRYVKELERLREQDKAAAKRKERLSAMSNDWMYTIWRVLYPIRCFVGFALAAVTVLIVTTLALSAADMWLNSLCGIRCGFVMDTPSFINPLDSVLVFLSKYFPLDSVALGVVAGYLLIASVYGIVKLGIRFALWQVFEIRPQRTWPQALLLLCAYLMFTLLSIMIEVLALLPQYSTFGSQLFRDAATNTDVPCRQSHTGSKQHHLSNTVYLAPCTRTQISLFLSRLTVTHPIFAVVFFCGHWAFVIVTVATLIYLSCKKRPSDADDDDGADDEDELAMKVYKETASLL